MTMRLFDVIDDLIINLVFYTRLPFRHGPIESAALARASWAAPVAGAIIGLAGAVTYWAAWTVRLPPLPAAGLAIAATLTFTGALHEDGLADMVDGLGGRSRAHGLEIMRDSRLGTYGTSALIVSMVLRISALASLAAPAAVAVALVVAHLGGRAVIPIFMRLVPPARIDGLSAGTGSPPLASAAIAATFGLVGLLFALPLRPALLALIGVGVTFLVLARLAITRFGGQTGDVLGALEQLAEVAIMLSAATQAGLGAPA
jgi:adenosylcobinamide-GDP ribazoletransferase